MKDLDLVIKGGRLITAEAEISADLGITEGRIAAVGPDLAGSQQMDADGLLVLPGGVDPHVHLNMPAGETYSSDNWETGTTAAACGGTTTVIDFVEPQAGEAFNQALKIRAEEAEGGTVLDFGLHMTVGEGQLELLDEIPDLVAAGVPSFKLYTTYAGFALDDHQLLSAMSAVSRAGGLVLVHCESDAIVKFHTQRMVEAGQLGPGSHPLSRPAAAEEEAINRVLALAATVGVPVYIVHVSTAGGTAALSRAKQSGQTAWGESCPQYLMLTENLYQGPGFEGARYVCSPPLRSPAHQEQLWQGLEAGWLDSLGTDHCPFNFETQKTLGREDFRAIPGGLPGIQSRLELVYHFGVNSQRISRSRWVELCCAAPARIFGLAPRKGTLEVGADADLVIFDPHAKHTIQAENLAENVDYTPYQGLELTGKVMKTYRAGQLIASEGRYLGQGRGNYLARKGPEEAL